MEEQKGLEFERYFTEEGKSPEDYFDWEKDSINITDDEGGLLFVQTDTEFPKQWSPLARKIVGSKYFFGEQGTSERESSVKQLVGRVSSTMARWGLKDGYFPSVEESQRFEDELAFLSYNQMMAFNSPTWFNVGVDKIAPGSEEKKEGYIIGESGEVQEVPLGVDRIYPQTSACFIQSVEDTMEAIMELAKREALLFKYGSGTGTNLSTLRSSREKLSGGGKPSGPMAYWAFYDKVAGIVKSGGKTRRAAKMDILDVDHPDIVEFIESKMREEEKLHTLIDSGVPHKEAQESVNYQNSNISVRAQDEFMEAAEKEEEWQTVPVHNKEMADQMPTYPAKDLMRRIAEGTHFCGDPGMQFDTTINRWHTCKNSGRIRASNPCSEFLFIDNSACNLASQNLKAFMKEDGTFDIEALEYSVRTTTIAQDIEIDRSYFPTREIAENSNKFRPLGMGYANIGSLVMSLGYAYDSDEARAVAASITALMTGKVYETSTELAEKLGAFEEFEKNKEPMLQVMKMHQNALSAINRSKLPAGLERVLERAEEVWERVIERGGEYGFRNAQATVLAPTGTIGFMMDCDTKGVEPEIGLVQTKLLSDGGVVRLVNSTVGETLKKLGYGGQEVKEINLYIAGRGLEHVENAPHLREEDRNKVQNLFELKKKLGETGTYSTKQIDEIQFYLYGYETMEGAPHIKEKDLAIFDCSNKPKWAKRTISPEGHLKMMAAVQPFLSGAISKTVNMPNEATVEEIEKAYMDAWKMGIKAVAIYRDDSKRSQPLNFSKESLESEVLKPVRRKLPVTTQALRHKFNIANHEGYFHVGLYDDGTPGETFISMNKEGSTVGGLMDVIGTLTSLALQYGVPLENLVKKFRFQRFEPRGLVFEGHSDIKTADSVIDYIFHFLDKQFLGDGDEEEIPEEPLVEIKKKRINPVKKEISEETGGRCSVCGAVMIHKGHCLEKCSNCGWEDPKGCGE